MLPVRGTCPYLWRPDKGGLGVLIRTLNQYTVYIQKYKSIDTHNIIYLDLQVIELRTVCPLPLVPL